MNGKRALPGLVCWYGGKGNMLGRLLPLIPHTRVYVEPFGGAASVLLNRKVAPIEVYNDLDGRLVNLMRVLQDPRLYRRLRWRLRHTPYSRAEYVRALQEQDSSDPVTAAWGLFVSHNQAMSGMPRTPADWSIGTAKTIGQGSDTVGVSIARFRQRVRKMANLRERILRVYVEQRDALDVIRQWDGPETTYYIDPPYPAETRSRGHRTAYRHEMTDAQHDALLNVLLGLVGAVVLSSYHNSRYSGLADHGWHAVEFQTACHAAARTRKTGLCGIGAALAKVPRTEVVWLNPAAQEWHRRQKAPLFEFSLDRACRGT